MHDKETSSLRVRDLFCTQEHKVYARLIQQGDKVESESNKKGESELKEEV
jgi:hypothetical protein